MKNTTRGRPKKHENSTARIKAHRKKQNQQGKRSEVFLSHEDNRALEALGQTWDVSRSGVLSRLLKENVSPATIPPFEKTNTKSIQHVVSISGGKDSLATLLHAKEILGDNLTAIFCDTGHEHPLTYEYVKYMSKNIHPISFYKADFSAQIERKRAFVKANWQDQGVDKKIVENALKVLQPTGNPFLDLCIWKGRFPSTRARFCSQELKRNVSVNQVTTPLIKQGFVVCMWVGIRADESRERANLSVWHKENDDLWMYRPLLK